jgi:hypothetical protein
MSTTSKKAPTKHEDWQDDIKTTEDQYREHDEWVRNQKLQGEKIRKRNVDNLAAQKDSMLKEMERNERKNKILEEQREKLFNANVIKKEKITTTKQKWYVKMLNVIMGWEE